MSERRLPRESSRVPEGRETIAPIVETAVDITYLGVRLDKAENTDGIFVPKREVYVDYVNDVFSLELQQKIAVSLASGEPLLIEGGTSIGKTTAVKKMCAELGYEVHYINLNGATDVEDLMGRYVPNAKRKNSEDPEYRFADGKVTSGLRQEEGKIKVIILDELNAATPNILIRLHEVLDAIERGGDVVLTEDASERVPTNNLRTKIVGLMNPPGKGFFGREPLDPAQLRRWVYQKEVTELPASTFSHATDALFGLAEKTEDAPASSFLLSRDHILSPEQLPEIPGIQEVLAKYKEFHAAAKEMLKARTLAEDQPQPFSYDDRAEPRRVRNFILRFYNGDINETMQSSLRYLYANKLESKEDKAKLEELIRLVEYTPEEGESKRRGLNPETLKPETLKPASAETLDIREAKEIFGQDFLGVEAVSKTFNFDLKAEHIPAIPFSRTELLKAKELGQMLILRVNKFADGRALTMVNMHKAMANKKPKPAEPALSSPEGSWYKDEVFYTAEAPVLGWALVSKEVVPNSESKNYLQQTERLVEYLKNDVFKGQPLPKEYADAIAEFEKKKAGIATIITSDWKKAAEELANLKLTELTRQSPVEALYDGLMFRETNKKYLLPGVYTWSKRRDSDGDLVYVGNSGASGADVLSGNPVYSYSAIVVSFSRSK